MTSASQRILHLIDSAGMYGAERVLISLLHELKESPFAGILGCIRERVEDIPAIADEARKKGIMVQFFTMRRGIDIPGLSTIQRFMVGNGIDLVNCHGYKPDILLACIRHTKFKVISTTHGWAKTASDVKGRLYQYLDRLAQNVESGGRFTQHGR